MVNHLRSRGPKHETKDVYEHFENGDHFKPCRLQFLLCLLIRCSDIYLCLLDVMQLVLKVDL